MIIIIPSDASKITRFGKILALQKVSYYYLLVITKYNIVYYISNLQAYLFL
jgi:hypothetical protein